MSNESQSFEMKGMNEIVKALNDLPAHLEQQILQNYLKSASNKYVVDPMKAGLPYSIRTESSIKVNKDKKQYLAFVTGPTTKAFWIRFVEKGTIQRTTKSGANRGQLIGKFRIPSIVDAQIQPIIDSAHKEIGQEIETFINKNKPNTK
jgi:hypothetical protein